MLALAFLLSQVYHTCSKLQFLPPYLVDNPRLLCRCFPLRRSILQLPIGNDSKNTSHTRSYFGGVSPHPLRIWISFLREKGRQRRMISPSYPCTNQPSSVCPGPDRFLIHLLHSIGLSVHKSTPSLLSQEFPLTRIFTEKYVQYTIKSENLNKKEERR